MFIVGWIIVLVMINQFVISGFLTQNACVAVRELEENHTDEKIFNLGGLKLDNKFQSPDSVYQNNDHYVVPSYAYVVT
jgi:hypothetical protein